MDDIELRVAALDYAVQVHNTRQEHGTHQHTDRDVLTTATRNYAWLTGPTHLLITLGPAVNQTTGQPSNTEGHTVKDTDKAPLIVAAEDAKHQPAAVGVVNWTVDDENVATVVTDLDTGTEWLVAGLPGSTVLTAQWQDSPSGPITGTYAVDVTSGDAVSLVITAGDPVPQ